MVIGSSALVAILFGEPESGRLVQAVVTANERVIPAPTLLEAATAARRACRRYGKGRGSPGVLNHGDCLAYGVVIARGEPLLFQGDDFAKTDVSVAPY